MRLRLALLLLWLLPGLAAAQSSLSGIVRDSLTQKPLPFASVFLANTTLGATTTEQGTFVFERVPAGSYDVVASYVGYRLAKQATTVGQTPQKLTLALAPTGAQLGEVVVRPRPNNASDYQRFKELFLGRSTFSQQCRIHNPDDVLVDFDPKTTELTAAARNYVQVDNEALGYRVKYYGLRFACNFNQQVVTFYGQPVFEEMTPRSARQRRQWKPIGCVLIWARPHTFFAACAIASTRRRALWPGGCASCPTRALSASIACAGPCYGSAAPTRPPSKIR